MVEKSFIRMSTRKIRYILSLMIVMAVMALFSCHDDEPGSTNPTDAEAVSANLKVSNSTTVSGDLPTPSADENAPILDDITDAITSTPGARVVIPVYLVDGDVKGFYVKVEGASSYFNITPIDPALTGRSATGRTQALSPYFILELPANLLPGTFCIQYCAYDKKGLVSNIVKRCINILSPGGNNSFLTANVWSQVASRYVYTFTNQEETTTVGETTYTTISAGISCNGQPTNVDVTLESRTVYINLTLNNDGSFTKEKKTFYQYVDGGTANCTANIKDNNTVSSSPGQWSYDAATQLLYLMYLDDDGSTFDVFKVQAQDKQLVLREDFSNGDYEETTFNPKP